jgi:hypothetical protein
VDIKMKLHSSRYSVLVVVALCALAGCASAPQTGVAASASEVKVYGSDKLTASQYEFVRHLWVDSWRGPFWLPTYPSEAEAIAALQAEAGSLGADGLINVICLDEARLKWLWSSGPAFLCYGNAIRVLRNAG